MTSTTLTHLGSEVVNEVANLQTISNSNTFLIHLITFALNLILAVDFLGYRFKTGSFRLNGFRQKKWYLGIGVVEIAIPCLRKGYYRPFFEDRLDEYESSHLDQFLFEVYTNTASIREIEALLPALNLKPIKKSQISERVKKYTQDIFEEYSKKEIEDYYPILYVDSLYENIYHESKYRKLAVIIVYGIKDDGQRADILAVFPALSESTDTYSRVFEHLKQIGLLNPVLVITDSHPGLKAAVRNNFPGASWQRCCVHMCRAVFRALPKNLTRKERKDFAYAVKSVFFDTVSKEEAVQKANQVISDYQKRYPEAVAIFKEGYADSLTFFDFPELEPTLVRTSNPIERKNRRIRKRTKRSGQYPSAESYLRQVLSYVSQSVEETLDRDYFPSDKLKTCLEKHKAVLETLPEQVRLAVERNSQDNFDQKVSVTLPEETDSTAFVALEDTESLKLYKCGLVEVAGENFVCSLSGKRVSVNTKIAVYVDHIGQARPLGFSLSAEDYNQTAQELAEVFDKSQTSPVLLITDTLDESEYENYQQILSQTLIQLDYETVIRRCKSMIEKEDRKETERKIKKILNRSSTIEELEIELDEFFSDFKPKHPDAYKYLSSQTEKLKSCFKIENFQKPVRRMKTASLSKDIFERVQLNLKEIEELEIEKLVEILLESCWEMGQIWKKSGQSAINPTRFLPKRKSR